MLVLAVTIVICITAVTIVAMKCSNERMMARDETITREIIKSNMVEKLMGGKKDADSL